MNQLRRVLLKAGSSTALLSLVGSGLLTPTRVIAAEWNKNAFSAKTPTDALKAFGASAATESRDVVINGPEIAENGAKVEIEISSNLPGTRTIALFADKNPMPLCGTFDFNENLLPYVKMQIKLAETTRLRAVVKAADGKFYVAYREVKVTLGGCGG